MIKEIIATGVDANAAIESGALLLGLPREEVQFEIIDLPRKGGFLGLKSYLSLSPKYLPEAEIRIFDFFPKAQLKKMDDVAYVRFASVYRQFSDVNTFMDELKDMLDSRAKNGGMQG